VPPFSSVPVPRTHNCHSAFTSNPSSTSNLDSFPPLHSCHSLLFPAILGGRLGPKTGLYLLPISSPCFDLPPTSLGCLVAATCIEDSVISFARRASRRGPLATVSHIMRFRAYIASHRMSAGDLLVPIPISVVASVEAIPSFKLEAVLSVRFKKRSSLSYEMLGSRRLLKPDHKSSDLLPLLSLTQPRCFHRRTIDISVLFCSLNSESSRRRRVFPSSFSKSTTASFATPSHFIVYHCSPRIRASGIANVNHCRCSLALSLSFTEEKTRSALSVCRSRMHGVLASSVSLKERRL
jgi:hypothetical protein